MEDDEFVTILKKAYFDAGAGGYTLLCSRLHAFGTRLEARYPLIGGKMDMVTERFPDVPDCVDDR